MLQCDQIPHLKVYRMKTYLPYMERTPLKDSVIIYNGKTISNVNNILTHRNIDNTRGKYKKILIDKKIHQRVGQKNIILNQIDYRKKTYKELSTNYSLTGIVEANLKNKFNMIYDFSRFNEIFFTNSTRMKIKTRASSYIKLIMDNTKIIDDYKKKTMMIYVDDWISVDVKEYFSNPEYMNNPIVMFYLCMKYDLDTFLLLGNMNIIFVTSKGPIMRLNPSELKIMADKNHKKPAIEYRRAIFKLLGQNINERELNISENNAIERGDNKNQIVDTIMKEFVFGATGTPSKNVEKEIIEAIEMSDKINKLNPDNIDEIINTVNTDEEIVKRVNKRLTNKKTGGMHASTKRDEVLRKKQMELEIHGKTLKEIIDKNMNNIEIPSKDISNKVFTTNKNATKKSYCNFDKMYNEKLKDQDLVNIFLDLNKREIPLFVKSIDVEDSSDVLNYKETYHIVLEDSNRVRHSLTFDLPKIMDDKFLYLGGNRKIINNQQLLIPIAKTGPDTVQTCTFYNKIFVTRYGDKVSAEIEKFKKMVSSQTLASIKFKRGNFAKLNSDYLTTIEYDNLSKTFEFIKIKGMTIYFSQTEIRDLFYKKGFNIKEGLLPIGIENNLPIYINLETQNVEGTNLGIIEYILSKYPSLETNLNEYSAGKKYMYTRAMIMKKNVPLILLLSYFEGISGILRRAKVKYYFSDTRPKVSRNEKFIQFNNGYLVYENKPFEVSLLMNGFTEIPTKIYDYEEFDKKDIYPSIFEKMFGRRNIASAFNNFYENFVDPVTYGVLVDMNLPTDITGMLLYANNLLVDDQYREETDLNIFRIRRNEIINALLYKNIATAYEKYKLTASNNNPKKMSIPKSKIIKDIQTLQTVEDYSVLNPIVELEKTRAISPKGPSGCNIKEAYKMNKRAFHESMLGMYTISTSPDSNVGVVRELTNEPGLVSPRGYMNLPGREGVESLNDNNLFGAAELLSPLGASRDDPQRLAMATKQSKHIVPVKKSSPVLISNGVEQTIQYELCKDFCVVAQEDGEVIERDDNAGLVVVKYKSGKYDAIDIAEKTVKNGAGGFFLSNKLICNLKVGQKFKADDILASDEKFFTDSKITGNRFNIGTLCKVAIMSSYATYEDSTIITKKMAQDMATEVCMPRDIVLGANTNVEYMVKVGDTVEVGDELIRFERSFDEDVYNKLLANIGEELGESISMGSKDQVKSKYSGVISDIKIYSTVGLNELSPSLRRIVKDYYDKTNKRKKILNKYDDSNELYKCGILFNEPTKPIQTPDGKVKGNIVNDGVLIQIYVKYFDELAIGDKITNFTALKGIVGAKVEEGKEAYSEFRPEEEISTCIAPAAIIARMTPSIVLTLLGNKVIVELKRTLKDIYEGKK